MKVPTNSRTSSPLVSGRSGSTSPGSPWKDFVVRGLTRSVTESSKSVADLVHHSTDLEPESDLTLRTPNHPKYGPKFLSKQRSCPGSTPNEFPLSPITRHGERCADRWGPSGGTGDAHPSLCFGVRFWTLIEGRVRTYMLGAG